MAVVAARAFPGPGDVFSWNARWLTDPRSIHLPTNGGSSRRLSPKRLWCYYRKRSGMRRPPRSGKPA
eukprot:11022378-Lingulodinium_polyedra.AAC.1